MKRSQNSLLHRVHSLFVALILAPIRFYSRFISPAFPRRCKYEPTCSIYAQDAIRELGVIRGSAAAGWRLLRCNPWSHGGWDPVKPASSEPSHNHTHKHA